MTAPGYTFKLFQIIHIIDWMFKYLILATNSEIREWIVEKKTVSGLRLAELQETFRTS